MFKKVKFFFILLIILIVFFYVNYKIDEDILFFADNSTKFYQGYAVIHNNFKDDTIRCQWLEEVGYCKFFQITNTMAKRGEEVFGAFPFALSYVNGILIKFISHKWILWLSEVIFILLIYNLYFSKWVDIKGIFLLLFCTPLFLQFYTFLDLAFQIFFISFFWIYYKKLQDKKMTLEWSFFYGVLTGLNFFFRVEGIFYLFFLIFLLFLFDKNKKFHFFYGLGNFVVLVILAILNYYFYQNIFGNRILANQVNIFSTNVLEKLYNILSIVWGNSFRIGFFQYMPWIVLIIFISLRNFKKFDLLWKIKYITLILSLIFIVILSPNDSNVDYGSRYLSTLILPFLILNDYIKQFYKKNKIINLIMILFFLVSGYFTYKYFQKMILKVNQDSSKIYQEIPEEFKRNSLWIFHSNFVPSIFGYHLVENKTIVLEHKKEVEEFDKLLNQHNYEKVVVFHSYFFSETNNLKDKEVEDRSFYEDEEVKTQLLENLKIRFKKFKKKEFVLRDRRIFDVYLFEEKIKQNIE